MCKRPGVSSGKIKRLTQAPRKTASYGLKPVASDPLL